MAIWKTKTAAVLAVAIALPLAACDVDQTEEGELPDVNVEEGQLPEYDVEGPDVDVDTDTVQIQTPDVDVNMPDDNDREDGGTGR